MVNMRLTLTAVLALFLVISFCNGNPWNIDDIEQNGENLDVEEVRGLIDGENDDNGVNLLEKRMTPNSMIIQGINTLARAYKKVRITRWFINRVKEAVKSANGFTAKQKTNIEKVLNRL
ncbi:hypothetical protein FSP39_012028 [Pinctada imbricata]|uniref:Secreted RxLR effector peptide protein n=1 Tax=Pinctada imbricata TaxID=66713 RepID=A0AA89BUI7_PINIB|nr:hypothetical protein FSP39_012028 [Pinctada imbricata]